MQGDYFLSDLHLVCLCGRCRTQMGVGEKSVCVSILGFKPSMQHREANSLLVISKYHIISLSPHPN